MDRTCDPCRVKGNTIKPAIGSHRERTLLMGRKRQETPEECTETAQGMPLAWGGYIIRPSDPMYSNIYDIPNSCGIYAWYSRDGDLLYIGRSTSMNSRLRSHHMPGFGGALLSYREVPLRHLAGVEMAHIKTLGPCHNMATEGASVPFWDGLCAAIDEIWRDVIGPMQARVCATETLLAEQIAARL